MNDAHKTTEAALMNEFNSYLESIAATYSTAIAKSVKAGQSSIAEAFRLHHSQVEKSQREFLSGNQATTNQILSLGRDIVQKAETVPAAIDAELQDIQMIIPLIEKASRRSTISMGFSIFISVLLLAQFVMSLTTV